MNLRIRRLLSVLLAGVLTVFPISAVCAAEGETVLSVGKSYTLSYDSPIENAYPNKAYTPESALTDGVRAASASPSDEAFVHLYRGTAVTVTIDLASVCAVTSVEVDSLRASGGIQCPRYVKVAVSEDGESFGTVGMLDDPDSIAGVGALLVEQKVELEKPYRARYVRVTFSSDVHTYIDEITVSGTADASGAESAPADEPFAERGFAGEIDGIGNIVLMYTSGKYTEAQLLPYLLYVDTEGNVTDTMFSSMLFLPNTHDFKTETGWNEYIDELLGTSNTTNLAALDRLVGEHSAELGEGNRYPVFLSVPYLAFGNYSLGGISPNNLENRTQLLKTYVDRIVGAFEDANFAHLELKGLYWHEEIVQYTTTSDEEAFVMAFNDYAHGKGLKTIWIPYYCSPGSERAAELGFDCATLQSGYAFGGNDETGSPLPGTLDDSAGQAKKYGLGMEFELDIGKPDFRERYYKYVHTGYKTGCMDGHMMMLYQGVTGILSCSQGAASSDRRQVYDMTYQYIKGTFAALTPVVAPNQCVVGAVGDRTSGRLDVSDGDSLRGDLKTGELDIPEGLPFMLEGDGFYLLNGSNATPGTYDVHFSVTDGYNLSELSTVKVVVYDPESAGKVALDGEVTAYTRLDASATTVAIPAGDATAVQLEDGWYYLSVEVSGKGIFGFVKVDESTAKDLPKALLDYAGVKSGGISWAVIGIVVGCVAVAGGIAGVAVAFLRKRKKS